MSNIIDSMKAADEIMRNPELTPDEKRTEIDKLVISLRANGAAKRAAEQLDLERMELRGLAAVVAGGLSSRPDIVQDSAIIAQISLDIACQIHEHAATLKRVDGRLRFSPVTSPVSAAINVDDGTVSIPVDSNDDQQTS